MPVPGGNKPSYIWTVNGSRWFIVGSLAGTKILAEAYGSIASTRWKIPESVFDAQFIDAEDLQYFNQVVDVNPTAGYSSRLLNSLYLGSSNLIRRSSDNATQDIGFLNSFGFDIPAFNTFIGAGQGFTNTWYDQFGINNAIQATLANQPEITATGSSNKRTAQIFDGIDDILPVSLLAPFFSGNDNPVTILAVVSRDTILSIDGILVAANSLSAIQHYALAMDGAPNIVSERHSDTGAAQHFGAGTYSALKYVIIGMMFSNNTVHILVNDAIFTAILPDIGIITADTCAIGGAITTIITALMDGRIDEILFWNSSIGLDNLQAGAFNINQFYAIH